MSAMQFMWVCLTGVSENLDQKTSFYFNVYNVLNNAMLYFSLDFSQAWLFAYLIGLFIFSDVAAILRSGDQLRHQQMFISASRSAGTLCEVHRDFSKGLLTFVSREKCQPVYTVLYPLEHTRFLSFPHKYMHVNCRIISGSDRFKSYHLSSFRVYSKWPWHHGFKSIGTLPRMARHTPGLRVALWEWSV